MKKVEFKTWVVLAVSIFLGSLLKVSVMGAGADEADDGMVEMTADPEDSVSNSMESNETKAEAEPAPAPKIAKKTVNKEKARIDHANAFVAGSDWEFDGFVAGGQDQNIRSMFYLNDLIYLNIGSEQGLQPGDRISIYKRGDRIRDPQSGKFMGYEVRLAAISRITTKVDDENCTSRILRSNEPVEIGDLIKKEN